jgi:hypothetical protein
VGLACAVWNDWQSSIFVVKASTVIGWLSFVLGLEGSTR